MAIPKLPWYDAIERVVAPTEPVADLMLVVIVAVTVLVLLRGSSTAKAAWVVYVVSP